ncbi:MAG: MBL fold metallo-hydrolase [Armatimonadetes bacterium]|nr:MBL fold metallo-hydrolase [Armatimonadota bacterium]
MAQSITFLGAAQTVTGSKHLLELNGHKVMVDCGLFQGGKELKQRNWQPFPIPPSEIECIVLTHAHNDHIGYLPRLVKSGFRGPIYATSATIGLCKISLPDSGRLQEEDARYHGKHGTSEHADPQPLYTEADAYEVLKLLKPVHYWEWTKLPGGAQFRYMPAGHILGSAFAEIYFENGERILMSGDLGRFNTPLIKDPTMVEFAEYLVLESTYGDRLHDKSDPKEQILKVLQRAVADRSCVLIPSFAIGRTQEVLWYLRELFDEGRLPRIPIYVDSPMANATILLYVQETDEMDAEMKVDLREGRSPFAPDFVHTVRDKGMSKQLNNMHGPMVVIAGSGMVNGGRIVHHLVHRIEDPSTIVLFTGYQAAGTTGRQLIDGADHIRLLGQELNVRAQIERLDSLSAHADYAEILTWLRGFKQAPKTTFLVHGEPPAQEALKSLIVSELGWKVEIPAQGDHFDL